MSGEDPVDIKAALEEKYHVQCKNEWADYQACADRLKSAPEGSNCGGWYNRYHVCLDTKLAGELFHKLK